jgi:hypothetical protein
VELLPCCSSTADIHHADRSTASLPGAECPHVDSSRNLPDVSFLLPGATVPSQVAASSAPLFGADLLLPDVLSRGNKLPASIIPPLTTQPRYHLYCSLLI